MSKETYRSKSSPERFWDVDITLRSGGEYFLERARLGFAAYAASRATRTKRSNNQRFRDRTRSNPQQSWSDGGVFHVRRSRYPTAPTLPSGDTMVLSDGFSPQQAEIPWNDDALVTDETSFFSPQNGQENPGQDQTRHMDTPQPPSMQEHESQPETQHFNQRRREMKTKLFSASDEPDVSEEALYAPGASTESIFTERTKPRNFVLSTFFTTLKVLLIAILCLGLVGMGVAGGVLSAYADTAPELDITMITNQDQSATLYDVNGATITTMMLYRNSEWATMDQIPEMLQNAFVAVEDVRFYQHDGIDIKRLASAAIGTLTGNFDGGGSTITQQLIKLQITGSEQSYKRKVQEASLALKLEKEYSKEQILEYYLNSVPLGAQNYGVKAAAKDYFGKELSELTVRECAMIGGLTQNPSKYDPRLNTYKRKANSMDVTNARTDTVLRRMYTAGFISKEQMDAALQEKVKIVEVSDVKRVYDMAYFVEYAIYDVITHFLDMRNLQDNKKNRAEIEREILTGGYKIYTTVDPTVQNTVQNTLSQWTEYPALRDSSKSVVVENLSDGTSVETAQPQAASVVIDPSTGQIRAMIGGRDEPQQRKLWNRAYQSHMEVGSSIKPLSVYGPALELGASPASIYLNYEAPIEGYGGENGYPTGGLKNQGPTTMRTGIEKSLNVVAARTLYESVGIDESMRFLARMGIDQTNLNPDGPGLALGTSAISPLQVAAAYATIANGGTYMQPISFTKVENSRGEVLIDAQTTQQRTQVFSPATSYLLTDMLEGAVNEGTGTRAQISGMHVAGKTGTNSDYRSVYFAGYTPYYASALWVGHDDGRYKLVSGASGGTYAAPLWQLYMSKIHESLPDKEFFTGGPEQNGLVEVEVCSVSGKKATDACRLDSAHKPITDWFARSSVPTENCDMHQVVTVDASTGKIAYEGQTNTRSSIMTVIPDAAPWNSLTMEQCRQTLTSAISASEWSALKNATPGTTAYDKYYSQPEVADIDDIFESSDRSVSAMIEKADRIVASDELVYSQSQAEELMSLSETLQTLVGTEGNDAAVDSLVLRMQTLFDIIESQSKGQIVDSGDEELQFNEYGDLIESE